MTRRHGSPFGSDPTGAIIAALRDELLVAPDEEIVDAQVRMMVLEQQLLAPARTPIRAYDPPVRRQDRLGVMPRGLAALLTCVLATFTCFGLDAAGALPAPLERITDSIARSLTITRIHPHHEGSHVLPAPVAPRPASPAGATPIVSGHAAADNSVRPPTSASFTAASIPSAPPAVVPPQHMKRRIISTPRRKHTGSGSPPPSGNQPTPGGTPPDGKNGGPPPGLPTGWHERAIGAATTALRTCAQATSIAPAGCPQLVLTPTVRVSAVHWTLVNQPSVGAVAIAETPAAGAGKRASSIVTVYEQFLMTVSYSDGTAGDRPYLAVSSGIASATMTWNGTAFPKVVFGGGPVTTLPTGVDIPPFRRPSVTDVSLLAALQAGFGSCFPAGVSTGVNVPGCPQADPSGSTLVGDPTQGAVVTFDPKHGTFTVAGTYAVSPPATTSTTSTTTTASPSPVTHAYTATLVFDGGTIQLLSIAGTVP